MTRLDGGGGMGETIYQRRRVSFQEYEFSLNVSSLHLFSQDFGQIYILKLVHVTIFYDF